MRYASVCDGISAVSVAWNPLGWECAWFSEIDRFACAVLAERWPNHHNVGDMLAIDERIRDRGPIDLLVGGTPCQSFSVAGLRGGLDDARGNLALRFCQLAGLLRPKWIVWENVPGVLSSNGGRDFGSILGAMEQLGYGISYRVLDAQFFGVPQRRRRVFVVGYLGDWRRSAAVLFDRESLRWNSASRRKEWQYPTGAPSCHIGVGCSLVDSGSIGTADRRTTVYAFKGSCRLTGGDGRVVGTLLTKPGMKLQSYLAIGDSVRRFTPRESERLQGFPDDWTLVPYRKAEATDTPRYKAIGNSMAVPVMRWIGERIAFVDSL